MKVRVDLSGFSASSTVGTVMLMWTAGLVGCIGFLDKLLGWMGGGSNYKEIHDIFKHSGIAGAFSLAEQ